MYDIGADHLVFDSQWGCSSLGKTECFHSQYSLVASSSCLGLGPPSSPAPSHVNKARQSPERSHEAVNLRESHGGGGTR